MENNTVKERWKQIPGFKRYEASSLGRLKSLNYKRTGKKVVLRPCVSDDGYLKTMLMREDGKYMSWGVHKWIALTFMGKKPKGYEINHIDGDKLNNSESNLEYTTRSKNVLHAYKLKLMTPRRGSLNGMAKLTEDDVLMIRKHAKENAPNYGRRALAGKYGVSEAQIKDIVTRRRNIWPHV